MTESDDRPRIRSTLTPADPEERRRLVGHLLDELDEVYRNWADALGRGDVGEQAKLRGAIERKKEQIRVAAA